MRLPSNFQQIHVHVHCILCRATCMYAYTVSMYTCTTTLYSKRNSIVTRMLCMASSSFRVSISFSYSFTSSCMQKTCSLKKVMIDHTLILLHGALGTDIIVYTCTTLFIHVCYVHVATSCKCTLWYTKITRSAIKYLWILQSVSDWVSAYTLDSRGKPQCRQLYDRGNCDQVNHVGIRIMYHASCIMSKIIPPIADWFLTVM